MRARRTLTVLFLASLLGGILAPTAGARPFETGLSDDAYDPYRSGFDRRHHWLQRTQDLGGDVVRILVRWFEVAPGDKPQNPSDPSDPNYRWGPTDEAVRDAVGKGLDVLLVPMTAPPWATPADEPAWAPWGSWKPDPQELGRFAEALSTRYSGTYDPDGPEGSEVLPEVDRWEVWNEPNLANHLTPQWTGDNCTRKTPEKCRPASPDHYRRMLNNAYLGMKGGDSQTDGAPDRVISGGLTSFGDYPGCCGPLSGDRRPEELRVPPARFVREMVSQWTLLDGLGQHIYHRTDPPAERAQNRDDVQIPDISEKLRRPLNQAVADGRAPSGPKAIWVTEFGWETDANGVSERTQARYLQEGFYRLWLEGVSLATWFRIVDQPDAAEESGFDEMGLHRSDATSKPAAGAFRFMFVTDRLGPRKVRYWGRAPAVGAITVHLGSERSWSDSTDPSRVFTGTIRLGKGPHRLWASQAGQGRSRTWVQR